MFECMRKEAAPGRHPGAERNCELEAVACACCNLVLSSRAVLSSGQHVAPTMTLTLMLMLTL